MNTSNTICVDTEFQSRTDSPTIPISVQLFKRGMPEKFYLHPRTPIASEYRQHRVFESPFAPIDYLGLNYREFSGSNKKTYRIDIIIFWSFKDIEYLFADPKDYRQYVLPHLERRRRISSRRPISLPWEVYVVDEDGKHRWKRLTLGVLDISAMQGAESLKSYASNVGVVMNSKDTYTPEEKSRMVDMYIRDPKAFEEYALGDAGVLHDIMDKTTEFYNKVAEMIGVSPRDFWGMSTGKIVGSIISEWIASQVGVPVFELANLNEYAGSEGITKISKVLRDKNFVYAAMVDGGRAVKERVTKGAVEGVLDDIDIDGCYGNGLRNQLYAVGTPRMVSNMRLRDFLNKYEKDLVPGLWTARISYENAPFRQDLLISKVPQAFTNWDLAIQHENDESFEDDKKVYDASMVLTTCNLYNATLTHDGLQVLKYYASKSEWSWMLDNATVTSALMYLKSDRVDQPTPRMFEGVKLSPTALMECSYEWVEVPLEPLMNKLIQGRKQYPKGTSLNKFLKLIINTIYGCIASAFFSEEGTGCSNVVVGNNITARARILAWCMAKGLNTYCSITDGGVFDLNRVLTFRKTSLDLFERLHRDDLTDSYKNRFAVSQPLMGRIVNPGDVSLQEIDQAAWDHLAKIFGKLDLFKLKQFKFESKSMYAKYTPHSKVDYRLVDFEGKSKIALRGMPKISTEKGRVTNPIAHELFDAIEADKPLKITLDDQEILSLSDWERHPRRDELLPHDQVRRPKTFYSHTPLHARYSGINQYKNVMRLYEEAKGTGDPFLVAAIAV